MQIRQWINDNATAMLIVALGLVVVAGGVLYFQLFDSGPGSIRAVYFLDMETQEVFEQPPGTLAPVSAPSGGQGVRAHLYTCGECEPDEWFGYLETVREDGQAPAAANEEPPYREGDHLLRELDNGEWVPYFSPAGERIREVAEQPCPDEHDASPRPCLP